MSSINPTVIHGTHRKRRYLVALLALALLALASLVALYLRTPSGTVNELAAAAAVVAVPASAELTRARAADGYATQLDHLRRQGQDVTHRVAVRDARATESYATQLEALRQQGQAATQAGTVTGARVSGAYHDRPADAYTSQLDRLRERGQAAATQR